MRQQLVIFMALFTIAVGDSANGWSASRQAGEEGMDPRPQQTSVHPMLFQCWEPPKRPSPTAFSGVAFASHSSNRLAPRAGVAGYRRR